MRKIPFFHKIKDEDVIHREICINEHSRGLELYPELKDITIRLSKVTSSDVTYMEITCGGLREKKFIMDKNIDFDRYYEIIESIDFKKMSSENDMKILDGWMFTITITKTIPFLSISKHTSLNSPTMGTRGLETDKLLKIYEEIKDLPGYKEYDKRIEAKRKRLERKDA